MNIRLFELSLETEYSFGGYTYSLTDSVTLTVSVTLTLTVHCHWHCACCLCLCLYTVQIRSNFEFKEKGFRTVNQSAVYSLLMQESVQSATPSPHCGRGGRYHTIDGLWAYQPRGLHDIYRNYAPGPSPRMWPVRAFAGFGDPQIGKMATFSLHISYACLCHYDVGFTSRFATKLCHRPGSGAFCGFAIWRPKFQSLHISPW